MLLNLLEGLVYFLFWQTDNIGLTVSNEELGQISQQLHEADVNRAEGVVLNLQAKTQAGNQTDRAPEPLFVSVPISVLERPTYKSLLAMHDNYVPEVGKAEEVTDHEKSEEQHFLDAVFSTQVMRLAHQFLASKNRVDGDIRAFKEYVRTIWFGLYPRDGKNLGSSGFEHVYLGEFKKGISGFHSWLRFYKEELGGRMNYLGYIRNIDLGHGNNMLEMPMKWTGVYKPISSIAVGGSPELEMAIATICFVARPNKACRVKGSNGKDYKYDTFTVSHGGKTYIGTAYPTV